MNYKYKELPELTGYYAETTWDLLQHEFYKATLTKIERKENTFRFDFNTLLHPHIRKELQVFLSGLIINKYRNAHEDTLLMLVHSVRLMIIYLNSKPSITSILDVSMIEILQEYPSFLVDKGRNAYRKNKYITIRGYIVGKSKSPPYSYICDFHNFITNYNKVIGDIFEEDVWFIDKLPFSIKGNHTYNNNNTISFTGIKQPEVRQVAKLWARYRLGIQKLSLRTVKNDIASCRVFSEFLIKNGLKTTKLSLLKRVRHMERFFEFLKDTVGSRKSRAVHIGKIRLLLKHAKMKGWDSPAQVLIYPKEASMGRGTKPKVLPELDFELLESRIDFMSHMHKGIFRLLKDTGMRIGEVLTLKVTDIKRENGEYYLRYQQLKHGNVHEIDLRYSEMAKLRQVLDEAIKNNRGSQYVFPSRTSIEKPYTNIAFWLAMKKFIIDQNILLDRKPIMFKAHDARRLKVTNAIKAEEEYSKVSKKIGHKDESSTDPYVGGVSDLEENDKIKGLLEMDDKLIADAFDDIDFLK